MWEQMLGVGSCLAYGGVVTCCNDGGGKGQHILRRQLFNMSLSVISEMYRSHDNATDAM